MDEPRDFLSGLIVGSVVGIALGLLFAPEAGDKTRERIRRQSEEWRDRAREQADLVADRVRTTAGDVAERVRGQADEFAARARSTAEDVLERGRAVVEDKSDRLRRAYEEGRDSSMGWSREHPGTSERSPWRRVYPRLWTHHSSHRITRGW